MQYYRLKGVIRDSNKKIIAYKLQRGTSTELEMTVEDINAEVKNEDTFIRGYVFNSRLNKLCKREMTYTPKENDPSSKLLHRLIKTGGRTEEERKLTTTNYANQVLTNAMAVEDFQLDLGDAMLEQLFIFGELVDSIRDTTGLNRQVGLPPYVSFSLTDEDKLKLSVELFLTNRASKSFDPSLYSYFYSVAFPIALEDTNKDTLFTESYYKQLEKIKQYGKIVNGKSSSLEHCMDMIKVIADSEGSSRISLDNVREVLQDHCDVSITQFKKLISSIITKLKSNNCEIEDKEKLIVQLRNRQYYDIKIKTLGRIC